MTDIVTQLRDRAYSSKSKDALAERAADEIEGLRKLAAQECDILKLSLSELIQKWDGRVVLDNCVAGNQPKEKDASFSYTNPGPSHHADRHSLPTSGDATGLAPDVTRPDNGEATSGRGHNTQEPFAWAADIPGKYGAAPTVLFGYTKKLVTGIAAGGGDVVEAFPLYRFPKPTLTAEERDVLERATWLLPRNEADAILAIIGRLG